MVRVLRWLLIIPAAFVAWYAAFFTGIALLTGLNRLCPAGRMVSQSCIAPWSGIIFNAAMCFGAGLAALLIMFASALLAPTHKRQVAVVTLLVGSAVAVAMAVSLGDEAYYALISAVAAGLFGLWVVMRRTLPLPAK